MNYSKENEIEELHETNQYNDDAFPVGVYIVDKESITPVGRGFMDLHWHEELQFTYVVNGTLVIRVNAEEYTVHKGEAIFINRNMLHITTELTEEGRYMSLNFPGSLLGFFPGSRMEQNYVYPLIYNCMFPAMVFHKEQPWQKDLIEELKTVFDDFLGENIEHKEYIISMKLISIWYQLFCHVKENLLEPSLVDVRRQERLQKMLNYIQENHNQNIQLKDIAKVANISIGECCRCFKKMVQMSPNKYLLNYRLSRGKDLLMNTNLSVTDIALEIGFQDISYFIQYFKKKNGCTPKEFRNLKC